MKYVWALILFAACGGGGGGATPDAGTDADGGTTPDAPDAPDAAPMVDTDGDGVFDHVDVCPTIADPAQVDLDGDHDLDAADLDLPILDLECRAEHSLGGDEVDRGVAIG